MSTRRNTRRAHCARPYTVFFTALLLIFACGSAQQCCAQSKVKAPTKSNANVAKQQVQKDKKAGGETADDASVDRTIGTDGSGTPARNGTRASETSDTEGYPVLVFGKELFSIPKDTAGGDQTKVAHTLSSKIEALVYDQTFTSSSLAVRDDADGSAIIYGDKVLYKVRAQEAEAESTTAPSLARELLERIKATIDAERAKRNLSEALDQVRLHSVKSNILNVLGNPLIVRFGIGLVGLLIIGIISYCVRGSILKYFHESTKRYTLSKIAEFTSYFICLIFLTTVFSDTLGSLAVILGATTAGVALALKELIASLAGWVTITFGDSYRVGDRIQLGPVKGDVIDIGLLRTTLMELGEWVHDDLYTGRIVRVANGIIFQGPMYNYSRDLPFLWDEAVVSVRFGSDVEVTRTAIEKVVSEVIGEYTLEAKQNWERLKEKYLVEDERIDPAVSLTFTEEFLQFTIRYPVDFRHRRDVKDKLYSGIAKAAAACGDKVKFKIKD